jgi:hypothetical protein
MSTRHLIEIDGDSFSRIVDDPHGFAAALSPVIHGCGVSQEAKDNLRWTFGVTYFAERHHSAPYHIQWGHSQRFDSPEAGVHPMATYLRGRP